jgi:hypothetical protein
VAYSFGEDDILVSMLSTSRERPEQFVKENLELPRGIFRVEVGHTNRSKRVAPMETWRKHRENRYVFKPTAEFEEYDFLEYATLPGAPVRGPETSSFW